VQSALADDGPIAAYSRERATALLQDHDRVRSSLSQTGGVPRVTVEPVLPADVVGHLLLLEQQGASPELDSRSNFPLMPRTSIQYWAGLGCRDPSSIGAEHHPIRRFSSICVWLGLEGRRFHDLRVTIV
jgi:hypothetical protein